MGCNERNLSCATWGYSHWEGDSIGSIEKRIYLGLYSLTDQCFWKIGIPKTKKEAF